jgi:hypothetical protein
MALKERKVRVKENAALNLSCEASGHPRPTISWNVNGTVSGPGLLSHAFSNPCSGFAAITGDSPRPVFFLVGK